jgi:outer membrane lipoprotein SlyB
MSKFRTAVFLVPLALATTALPAQNRNNSNYYQGMRSGSRGNTSYYNNRDRPYHDDHRRDQGGIGPGKGALIGGAGGAVLGAVFGGGLKGTIIGGAAGAGIGAVVGQAAQNNRDNHYHPY